MTINYKLVTLSGESKPCCITRLVDNVFDASIPFDNANKDYQEYLEWVAEGNTAEAAD